MIPREIGVCSTTDPSQKEYGIQEGPRIRRNAILQSLLALFLLPLVLFDQRPLHVEIIMWPTTTNCISRIHLPKCLAATIIALDAPSNQSDSKDGHTPPTLLDTAFTVLPKVAANISVVNLAT